MNDERMSKEHNSGPQALTAIHIDLTERSLTFEADDQSAMRLTFSPTGVLYELLERGAPLGRSGDRLRSTANEESPQVKEKEPTVTLTGRLKTQPRPGRPDSRGRPTAVARFAAHQEGEAEAHLYFASFHRHTARIALGLAKEALITVQGYPHPTESADRSDSLSVINILNYPGKPKETR